MGRRCRPTWRVLAIGLFLITIPGLLGCTPALRKESRSPEEALVRVRFFLPEFRDDMDTASLAEAVERNLSYLRKIDPETVFFYGPDRFTCRQVLEGQETLLGILQGRPDAETLNREIRQHFLVYRATGRVGNRNVLFTGYFEPVYEGRLTPDDTFRYPLYTKPGDLVRIDLSPFREEFQGKSIVARIDGDRVLPYFSRQQIEEEKVLKGKNLEVAWLKDPVDVAFLHIQGSGRIQLPDGSSISVGYHASNGRPYHSIGRYMLEKGFLSREEMSMQAIRRFLSRNPQVRQEVLNANPSYVFFRTVDNGPYGSINVPLTPGRSLALDSRLFPRGALCFVACERPVMNKEMEITGWKTFSRIMVNQDTGGAIRGAGRADIFWGSGPYAEVAAGHLKHDGDLYVLVKRP
ncbi:MAG: MltA domain-containing protein [Deltaproteobacteria bacterium]|nr:MltA domain-containing protein [Deltaproteobacteria bacterium]